MPFLPDNATILDLLRFALLLVTPIILILTFRRSNRITTLEMCHTLSERHMELMWLTVDDPKLNGVWDPIPPDRKAALQAAQAAQQWGGFRAMTEDERARYRFARRAIEHVEQAFEAHEHGWMPDYIWKSWEARMQAWTGSDYAEFVLDDLREFKSSAFFNAIVALRDKTAGARRGA